MYGENVSYWTSHKTHVLAMKALEMTIMMTMTTMTVDDSDNTTAITTTTMITSTTAILYLQQLSLSKIGRSLQNCTFCMVYLTTLSVA